MDLALLASRRLLLWHVFSAIFAGGCATWHPRRPRGGKSGREKRRDRSYEAQAEKPLGTDSHRTISKRSSECQLLIGYKKMLCIIVPNQRTASPEFFS